MLLSLVTRESSLHMPIGEAILSLPRGKAKNTSCQNNALTLKRTNLEMVPPTFVCRHVHT